MTPQTWEVRLTAAADRDLDDALWASIQSFGATQARLYEALILDALGDLGAGPSTPRSRVRDDIAPGHRSLHVARRGRHGSHVLVYRVGRPGVIEVVRILHERMDIARHLPPGPT